MPDADTERAAVDLDTLPDGWLDLFVLGYCHALLWADTYDNELGESGSVDPYAWHAPDRLWSLHAFDTESQSKIREDCEDFVSHQWHLLSAIAGDAEQSGHDFLLTRNGHGAGFWDRGYGDAGRTLTDACKPYGETSAWCHGFEDPDTDNLAHLN